VALHEKKGIAATSMRDIASQAGVGAVTVYRHFPDIESLVGACSGAYFEQHPLPDMAPFAEVPDPEERLRRGLAAAYAHHRETAPMIRRVMPELTGHPLGAPYEAHWRDYGAVLLSAWPDDAPERPFIGAAIALALRFDTWDLLAGSGLNDDQAVALMLRLIHDC